MASLSLRAYLQKIENLIDRGQTEEAVAHCKHILKKFPKHVDTYRLLGKSYLEMQRYQEASDVLQRVLSVIPDDFISQIGMSIIREDSDNFDEAIWHMERAFEIQPSNNAVQEELKRLYGRRDGIVPQKILLTRGALVRMYVRGEAYPQAIAEGIAALKEDQQRPDIELLLAKSYLRTNQINEGYRLCQKILESLPYSYEGNQLIAEIHILAKQSEQAESYLERIRMLDPYAAFVNENTPTSAKVDENAIIIDELEYDAYAMNAANQSSAEGALFLDEPFDDDSLAIPAQSDSTDLMTGVDTDLSWLADQSFEEETPAKITPTNQKESIPSGQNEAYNFTSDTDDDLSWLTEQTTSDGKPGMVSEEEPEQDFDAAFLAQLERVDSAEQIEEPISAETIEETGPADSDQKPISMPEFFKSSAPIPAEIEAQDSSIPIVEPIDATTEAATAENISPIDFDSDDNELPDWLKELDRDTKQSDIDLNLQNEIDSLFTVEGLIESAGSDSLPLQEQDNFDAEKEFTAKFLEELENEPQHPGKTRMFSMTADLSAQEENQSTPEEIPQPIAATEATDIPEWLKELEEKSSPLSDLSEEEEIPINQAEGISPIDLSSLSFDEEDTLPEISKNKIEPSPDMQEEEDAFAWLESLAAKQGVKEETLLSSQEDRSDAPPAWIQQETDQPGTVAAHEPETEDHVLPALAFDDDELEEESPVTISKLEQEFPESELPDDTTPAEPAEETAWIDEFESTPRNKKTQMLSGLFDAEDEPIEPLAETNIENEKPEKVEEIPDWLKELEQQTSDFAINDDDEVLSAEEPIHAQESPEIIKPDEIPAWLADKKPQINQSNQTSEPTEAELESAFISSQNIEAEISNEFKELFGDDASAESLTEEDVIFSFEEEDIESPIPNQIIAENLIATNKSVEQEVRTPESMPVSKLETVQALIINETEFEEIGASFDIPSDFVEDLLQETEPASPLLTKTSNEQKRPYENESDVLQQARNFLKKQEFDQALMLFDLLIENEQSLEEIIDDLTKAIYDNPLDPAIYIRLGDAHIRNNQIQKALDMYQEAENLLQK